MSLLTKMVKAAHRLTSECQVDSITNLDEYFKVYGAELGKSAQQALNPLHVPGRDRPLDFSGVSRKPFDPQAHVITATVKRLNRGKSAKIVAAMGTGKTLMGMLAVHRHADGKPYRGLIFCPGQLVKKWERELRETIPGVQVYQLDTWRDVIKIDRHAELKAPTWYIISRDRAKLGAKWRAVKSKNRKGMPCCPSCGQVIEDQKTKAVIDFATLSKKKLFCQGEITRGDGSVARDKHGKQLLCNAPLWTYTHELKRWEPALYIKRHLRGFFDYLICDECFPGDTLVSTPDGQRPIKDMLPGDTVTSMSNGVIANRTVTRRIKKRLQQSLIRVTHSNGSFRCTPNHKIWTTRGYIEAGRLDVNDSLILQNGVDCADHHEVMRGMPCGVSDMAEAASRTEDMQPEMRGYNPPPTLGSQGPSQGKWEATAKAAGKELSANLRIMRQGGDGRQERLGSSLLRKVVFRQGKMDVEELSRASYPEDEQERTLSAAIIGMDEAAQCQGGCSRESKCHQAWAWIYWNERRERTGADAATACTAECSQMAGVLHGISGADRQARMEVTCIRHRASAPAADDRSGRRITQFKEAKESRPTQNQDSKGSGLHCDSVLEFCNRQSPTRNARQNCEYRTSGVQSVEHIGRTEEYVYDLEVEDTHCYFANGILVSNCHQEKSSDSAQANALGSLASVSKKVIGLTGTLIGGYADHIRPLLFRLAPKSVIEEGFGWRDYMPFNERYGRIEIRTTEKESHRSDDNSQSRGSKRQTTKLVRPGIMLSLFGRHLIDKAVFLSLDELADNLPPLVETVPGVDMDAEVSLAYRQIEDKLSAACKEMAARGDKRLLGKMLQVLLSYPDHPYGFGDIGYYEPDGSWTHVVTCPDFDAETVRPKERQLINDVLAEKAEGRQVWIYCQMTDKRDVLKRLESLLAERGLRVKVLRSKVKLADREEWIEQHGRTVDVVLSHPQLVETGLDLFSKKPGAHNFATLIFYQTGYNLFTLRQAARRAWRIGQKLECRVKYYFYNDTMQARAMTLMGKKMTAASALEGKFSSEGLAAMAGEDSSVELAMARSLANKLDDLDAQRAWEKVASKPAPNNWTPHPVEPPSPTAVVAKPCTAPPHRPQRKSRNRIAPSQLSFMFD